MAVSDSKVGRRRFLKYIGAGVAAATVAGFGYYATTPTSTQTASTQSIPLSPTADFDYKPRWINPTSADRIYFLNKSRNPDGTDTDLEYS